MIYCDSFRRYNEFHLTFSIIYSIYRPFIDNKDAWRASRVAISPVSDFSKAASHDIIRIAAWRDAEIRFVIHPDVMNVFREWCNSLSSSLFLCFPYKLGRSLRRSCAFPRETHVTSYPRTHEFERWRLSCLYISCCALWLLREIRHPHTSMIRAHIAALRIRSSRFRDQPESQMDVNVEATSAIFGIAVFHLNSHVFPFFHELN